LPEDVLTKNTEKDQDEKRIRALADAIAGASVAEKQDDDKIEDPDEYRLRHPFSGMVSSPKNLASELNKWESGNSLVYKLEDDHLKHFSEEAMANLTKINSTLASLNLHNVTTSLK